MYKPRMRTPEKTKVIIRMTLSGSKFSICSILIFASDGHSKSAHVAPLSDSADSAPAGAWTRMQGRVSERTAVPEAKKCRTCRTKRNKR